MTLSPWTGLPLTSVTRTSGSMGTAVPAVALCPSPALAAMVVALPALRSMIPEVTAVRLPELKLRV